IAALKGINGDHRAAVKDLERLYPLERSMASFYPHEYYSYLNSLAVEFGAVGRLDEAMSVCKLTVISPYAEVFPEMVETRDEIAQKSRRRHSTIVLSIRPRMASSNVLPLSIDRTPNTDFAESSRYLPEQQARVLSFTNWKTQMSREPLAKQKPVL